ncbi:MAG TPA: FISUMP domain-containing protein [Saprospiraceae bacterium]|nr:FISUMP domain-containing protein [Saprospiraceae bacterium]
MKLITYIIIVFFAFIITSCQDEELNPNDIKSDEEVKDNYVVLKEQTTLLKPEQESDVVNVDSTSIKASAAATWAKTIQVGDVLVSTGTTTGIAFYRKVTSIDNDNNTIIFNTTQATLKDAYESWTIDTRSDRFTAVSRDLYTSNFKWKTGEHSALSGYIEPDMDVELSYNETDSYFTSSYNANSGITGAPRFHFHLEDLQLTLSGNYVARAAVSFEKDVKAPPIEVAPIATTGLAIYIQPKLVGSLELSGELQSPEISKTFGAYTIDFKYDETTADTIQYSFIHHDALKNENSSWQATGAGTAEVKLGFDTYIGILGVPDLVKCGVFIYGFGRTELLHKGSFSNPQPRVALDAFFGIGAVAFAEVEFFGGQNVSGWLPSSYGIESPEFETRFKKMDWPIVEINTCSTFQNVTFINNGLGAVINIGSDFASGNGPHSRGYDIWVDNNKLPNTYFCNTDNNFLIQSSNQVIRQIYIDAGLGCVLIDNILDPSVIANCTQKFTDPRDGNEYCTATIGNLIWMTENLRYTESGSKGHWYNDEDNADNLLYGRLYTFEEVANGSAPLEYGASDNVQGICPNGWRLPTNGDFNTLLQASGGINNLKLSTTALWNNSTLPSSASGFNAVPGGESNFWVGAWRFGNKGNKGTWWSANKGAGSYGENAITVLEISDTNQNGQSGISSNTDGQFNSIKEIGYSCRCVKNK